MDFKTDRPIYLQIVDYCFSRIMSGAWKEAEKIPSVRELAVQMAVNTHTVLKAFDYLQQHDLIAPRRGMGYFLEPDAKRRVGEIRREEFFETTLEDIFSEMEMLGIGIDRIVERWNARNDKKQNS